MEAKPWTISADPNNPEVFVIVAAPDGQRWRIDAESADPEHRLTAYRLAAGWFGNLPAGYVAE